MEDRTRGPLNLLAGSRVKPSTIKEYKTLLFPYVGSDLADATRTPRYVFSEGMQQQCLVPVCSQAEAKCFIWHSNPVMTAEDRRSLPNANDDLKGLFDV